MKKLNPIIISGKEVLPLIEGGKGVAVSDGKSSGAWAKAGAVGTISGVFADIVDENGRVVPKVYTKKARPERHKELIEMSIKGGITQAKIAHEVSGGNGRIHMNVLWEMGGSIPILEGVMDSCENLMSTLKQKTPEKYQDKITAVGEKVQETLGALRFQYQKRLADAPPVVEGMLGEVKNLVHGITCGAGMPYKLAEIAARYGLYYYPIVSSARAFRALWLRSYKNCPEYLGGVVYEDPWLAGGHNGLSNSEDPTKPERPYERLVELRKQMNEFKLNTVPIILAGGVWNLKEFEEYIDNPDIGPIAFQLGTRPLLTQESPVAKAWQGCLRGLKKGDIVLQQFSPTGFYSSAVRNKFIQNLFDRKDTEMPFREKPEGIFSAPFQVSDSLTVYLTMHDQKRTQQYAKEGKEIAVRTPDTSLIFLSKEEYEQIKKDRIDCVGCLSACAFSGWSQATGHLDRIPDSRSFCINKTLTAIAHGESIDNNLMFAGHSAYRFGTDPMYKDGYIPTVEELIDALLKGN
ncbi:MAG: nitronate monooxygenase [Lactobacillales bacterium]|jgi:NAD(P)H-dependent flavin oxidoreductase YrpB (nitropropane dioxygenase family)|nr:nitronate monooxygenase [Lactobacillales bacterium]